VQTTLLGLAIAFILALVAALVGPSLIDWGRFRPTIEAEASRLIGAPVRVTGPIQAALLPSPSLTLHAIEVGPPDGSGGLRARSLAIELSLGSLVRGQWRAAEMHLVGPDFNIGLNSAGNLTVPQLSAGFDADTLSIDRLNIEDGHAILVDARSGSRLVLDKLWFNGEIRSLAGPFKGDGAFVLGGELYAYRVAAGRRDDDGAVKLRLNIDPLDRPMEIDVEGAVSMERGAPRFDGSFNIARPAGVVLPSGETFANVPWSLTSKIKSTAASALLEQIEFQYGPEERAVKLTGTAELKFGNKPRFDGVLSARQIDLDRAFATPEATRQLPFNALTILGDNFSGVLGPSIPARIGVSIDLLTLAGATVQTLRGDLATDGGAWNVDGLEFRAPGFTQVNLSGRLDVAAKRLGFIGPLSIDSSDPSALVAWLEGASPPSSNRMKPLRARGEVTLGGEKIAIERLKAEIDRKTVEGRLVYAWAAGNRPARLEAELNAAELDVDALLAFADAARGGTKFETPREVTLGLDIGRALIAGVEARQVSARLRRDAKGLQVERFAVGDLGGATLAASGQIDTGSSSPRGKMSAQVDVKNLAGVLALAEKFSPRAADSIRRLAGRLPPTRMYATLAFEESGPSTAIKLTLEGRSGAVRVSLLGEASRSPAEVAAGDFKALSAADFRFQGKLDSDEGAALIGLLNLDKLVAVDKRAAQLVFTANGPLGGTMNVDGRLLGGALDASAKGTLRFDGDETKADLRLAVAAADARPWRRGPSARPAEALPVTLVSNLTLSGGTLKLDDLSGTLAGAGVRGRLALTFGQPMRLEGQVEADTIDLPSIIAVGIGVPVTTSARTNAPDWSTEPFAQGPFEDVEAGFEFRAARLALAPTVVLRQAHGRAKFSRSGAAFTEVEGSLADGQAKGELVFNRNDEGVYARARFQVSAADAAILLPGSNPPAVAGKLGINADIEGSGLSPAGLVGSLAGNGTISLAQAKFTGLDPKVFETSMRAVDEGTVPDAAKIGEIARAALDGGHLAISSIEGVITVANGQIRLTNTIAQASGADLTMAGNVDLVEGDLSARLALSARAEKSTAVTGPVLYVSLRGPLGEPKRTIDVTALTAWLALRAVEQQSKRLEGMEGEQRLPVAGWPTEIPRTLPAFPMGEQAPPLPPPVDIGTIPGISEPKPVRRPVRSQGTIAPPPKPAAAKPPSAVPPLSRAPLDLSANPNN
jgi:large subunit ribosomal protein L24